MGAPSLQLSLFPDTPEPRAHGDAPAIAVRKSSRAKRLSIKVFPRGRVEVVVPRRARPADVQAFVEENRDWITRAIASFGSDSQPDGAALPVRIGLTGIGRAYVVAYRAVETAQSVRCREAGSTLILSGPVGERAPCVQALKRWLARVAKRELTPRLEALSRELGLPYGRTQIRAQRTCWGSRSSSGTISLNLCLLFLEPPVVRYLMIHELCHGRHMDHSRRFWNLVGHHEPRYRRLDRALSDSWRHVPAWLDIY